MQTIQQILSIQSSSIDANNSDGSDSDSRALLFADSDMGYGMIQLWAILGFLIFICFCLPACFSHPLSPQTLIENESRAADDNGNNDDDDNRSTASTVLSIEDDDDDCDDDCIIEKEQQQQQQQQQQIDVKEYENEINIAMIKNEESDGNDNGNDDDDYISRVKGDDDESIQDYEIGGDAQV